MKLFLNSKVFAIVCGTILFLFGIFGFAFRSSFDIGGQYLLISLILGFWGLVTAFFQ